jgi:hypothetical protein
MALFEEWWGNETIAIENFCKFFSFVKNGIFEMIFGSIIKQTKHLENWICVLDSCDSIVWKIMIFLHDFLSGFYDSIKNQNPQINGRTTTVPLDMMKHNKCFEKT